MPRMERQHSLCGLESGWNRERKKDDLTGPAGFLITAVLELGDGQAFPGTDPIAWVKGDLGSLDEHHVDRGYVFIAL